MTTATKPRNTTATLKSFGVDVGKTDVILIDPMELTLYIDENTPEEFRGPRDIIDPRHKFYDPSVNIPIDEDFKADLIANGVLTPVRGRRDGEDVDGRPRIIITAGRQRVKTLRVANNEDGEARRIKLFIGVGSDAEIVLQSISENAQRVNTDQTSPLSLAWKVKVAIQLGADKEKVRQTAKLSSIQQIDDLLSLLEMDPEAQAAFDQGVLPKTAIRDMARVPQAKQAEVARAAKKKAEARAETKTKKAAKKAAKKGAPAPKPAKAKAKTHEVRQLAEAARTGKSADELPARLKVTSRRVLEGFEAQLAEAERAGRTDEEIDPIKLFRGAIRLVLGHEKALAGSIFEPIRAALEVDTNGQPKRGA